MKAAYYWLDLLIGFGCPLVLHALRRREKIDARDLRLFWLGAFLGLFWETPVFAISVFSPTPIIVWTRPLPLPWEVFHAAHTLWDGAIFLAGVRLIDRVCPRPTFARFRWCELAILLAWGQATSLAVEWSSMANDGWKYVTGYWWNPTLFQLGPHVFTLWPQVPWLLAPLVFYAVAVYAASSRPRAKPIGARLAGSPPGK
jgi:hypothetical protein